MVELRCRAFGKGQRFVAACVSELAVVGLAFAFPEILLPASDAFDLGGNNGRLASAIGNAAGCRRDFNGGGVSELVGNPAIERGVVVVDDQFAA